MTPDPTAQADRGEPIDGELLLSRFLDGELDASEHETFQHWLRSDRAHIDLYIKRVIDHHRTAELTAADPLALSDTVEASRDSETDDYLAILSALDAPADSELALVDQTDEFARRDCEKKKRTWLARRDAQRQRVHTQSNAPQRFLISYAAVWIGTAAIIGLVVWLGWPDPKANSSAGPLVHQVPETDSTQIDERVYVATVVSSIDARWASARPRAGRLELGQQFMLRSGLAQVTFADGITLIIQGPATFEPTGPNAIRLASGKLCIDTPSETVGFQVTTPAGVITDHRATFGVEVMHDGITQTHAFAGTISLDTQDAAGETTHFTLDAGQAVQSAPHGEARFASADLQKFVRHEEFSARAQADDSAYHRWLAYRYDLQRDPDVIGYYVFDDKDVEAEALVNRAAGGTVAGDGRLGNTEDVAIPRWVAGRFPQTQALRFGHASRGRTYGVVVPDSDALDLDSEMTFALWVRADDPSNLHGTLLSKRETPAHRMNYQVAIFSEWQSGGRELQLGSGRDDAALVGFSYSPASARFAVPGWHHVAITADGQTIRYYIDGEQVHNLPQPLQPLTNGVGLLIGTSSRASGPPLVYNVTPFNGDISEVLIAKRAFTDDDIRLLFENSCGNP